MKNETIPQEIYEQVEAELLEGEQVLWVGLPDLQAILNQNRLSTRSAKALAIGVSVLIGAGLLSTRGTVMNPTVFVVFGLIMALILAMIGVRLVKALWFSKQPIYVVTDQRALIIEGTSAQSYGERDIDFIERQMRNPNKGDIIFKREARSRNTYYGNNVYGSRLYDVPVGFFGIDNPREVEALMLKTFRARDSEIRREKLKYEALEEVDAPQYVDEKHEHLSL